MGLRDSLEEKPKSSGPKKLKVGSVIGKWVRAHLALCCQDGTSEMSWIEPFYAFCPGHLMQCLWGLDVTLRETPLARGPFLKGTQLGAVSRPCHWCWGEWALGGTPPTRSLLSQVIIPLSPSPHFLYCLLLPQSFNIGGRTFLFTEYCVLGTVVGMSHMYSFFFKDFILFIFREREAREKEKETSMCGCLLHTPYQGPGLQPRHVPWLGIEPATLWFAGWNSIHWARPARVHIYILM